MRYQVDFLIPLKLQKISYYFGLCRKILLANQFAGFLIFDLCDLLIIIRGVHCYIVLVKHIKKSNKNIFIYIFFLFIKMVSMNKNTKKSLRKKHMKDIKILLKKEKEKGKKRPETDIKIFLQNKKKNCQYHHDHNKNLAEEQKQN